MTDEERKELEQELENLEFIIKFHSIRPIIKNPKELEKHLDAILDRINEVKKKLKNE